MKNPTLTETLQDPEFTQALLQGDLAALENHPAMEKLAEDPEFLRAAESLGLSSSGGDPKKAKKELSSSMAKLQKMGTRIKNDPELRKALERPETRRALEKGDFSVILKDKALLEALNRVSQKP